MRRVSIVWMQGEEADSVIDPLVNRQGVVVHGASEERIAQAIATLRQWESSDLTDHPEVADGAPHYQGQSVAAMGPYILTWHTGLSYIGLDRMVKD